MSSVGVSTKVTNFS